MRAKLRSSRFARLVIDAAQESPGELPRSRGFPFEFTDGPVFRRRLQLASVPREQMNLRQVQNIHAGMNCMRVMTENCASCWRAEASTGVDIARVDPPSQLRWPINQEGPRSRKIKQAFLRQHRQLRQHFVIRSGWSKPTRASSVARISRRRHAHQYDVWPFPLTA